VDVDGSAPGHLQHGPGEDLTEGHHDGDLGPYREMAVTFFVREPGVRSVPLLGAALGLLRGNLGAYIHQLPVDGEFTCEAGRVIWGFPKFVAEIAIFTGSDEQTSVLTVGGRHVLTHTVRTGGGRSFSNRRQASYAYRNGVVYRTPSVMSGAGVGARLGGGRVELGTHPLAHELRTLGLPKKALFSTFVARMTGAFYAAEALGRQAGCTYDAPSAC